MPKTAAIIDLSHNVIAELRPEDFANLSRAVDINLNHNLISHIDKEVGDSITNKKPVQKMLKLWVPNKCIYKSWHGILGIFKFFKCYFL